MTRRELLILGAGLVAGCGERGRGTVTGSFVGASHDIGHLLRGGAIPAPSRERRMPVVIIGGGIAGLTYGVQGIPERWRSALRGHDLVEPLLKKLLAHVRG